MHQPTQEMNHNTNRGPSYADDQYKDLRAASKRQSRRNLQDLDRGLAALRWFLINNNARPAEGLCNLLAPHFAQTDYRAFGRARAALLDESVQQAFANISQSGLRAVMASIEKAARQ